MDWIGEVEWGRKTNNRQIVNSNAVANRAAARNKFTTAKTPFDEICRLYLPAPERPFATREQPRR
jgi:hypothetical protein